MRAVLLLSLLLLAGCVQAPLEAPEDFRIEHSWGACHADWGHTYTNISSDGKANYVVNPYSVFPKRGTLQLSKEEMSSIYTEVMLMNFFSLDKKYNNPNVLDGSCSRMFVYANGAEHSVVVSNLYVFQYDSISKKIQALLDEKAPSWNEINATEDCSKAEVVCRTATTEQKPHCESAESVCKSKVRYNLVRPEDKIFAQGEEIKVGVKLVNQLQNEVLFRVSHFTVHDAFVLDPNVNKFSVKERFESSEVDFCSVEFDTESGTIEPSSETIFYATVTCTNAECVEFDRINACRIVLMPKVYVTTFGSEKLLENNDIYVESFRLEP